MSRSLRASGQRWPLAATFTISRGSKSHADVVVVEIEEDGVLGRGECVPYPRYAETVDSVLESIGRTRGWVESGGEPETLGECLPAGAARNAVDCALWDLRAKQTGRRVWELARCPAPVPVVTAYTLSLDTPEAMARSAREHAARPLLKLKLDRDQPIERVAAVRRAAPACRLIVDANEAWEHEDLARWLPMLGDLGVELVEQPLPAGTDHRLAALASPIPIGADESCHTSADLDGLRDRYRIVNIKLDKTGGLTEALRLRAAALSAGLEFMVGCMVGTSLSMAPATVLTPGARVVDLDGPLLLAHDREPCLRYDGALVHPPTPDVWG